MNRHLSIIAGLGMCFFAPITIAHAQHVKADPGGIAIGGAVTSSTINIGVPPEQLAALVRQTADFSETQKKLIAKLESELDVNQRQIRAALNILGEKDIPPERLAGKLLEIAERFKELEATASAQPGDSPTIVSLKAEAQKAVTAGELIRADALLAEVEAIQRRDLDRLAVNAAETSARRGEIALTRLRYRQAAEYFANAAAVFPPQSSHEDKRITYLEREARALELQGEEFGDNDALLGAIERYRRLVELMPRERVPLDWARTQGNLGSALSTLGHRKGATAMLEEAVAAYREALKERTREPVPFDWARTQMGLGIALSMLGYHETETARLEEAVAAFREALKELTRERVPFDWALAQSNLGTTLKVLGERESGTVKLDEAVAAYREALKESTRERGPLQWAWMQNELGNALLSLGERESGTAKLEEAIVAYHEALKERTRERVPFEWAGTQMGLGTALSRLGQLEEAVAAYREALKEHTRERDSLEWAKTQNNLGMALGELGERESGTGKLEEAVVAYREARKELTRERAPLEWARNFGNEGLALMVLAERRGDAAMAETALSQINTAFETLRDGGDAEDAAYYEHQLPGARDLVSRLRGG